MLVISIIMTMFFSMIDSSIIENDQYLDHLKMTTIRFLGHCVAFVSLGFDWWYFVIAFLVHVALFDSMLNLWMGWRWNFIGSTSLWDRFWKERKTTLYIIKGIALVGAIILQILLI